MAKHLAESELLSSIALTMTEAVFIPVPLEVPCIAVPLVIGTDHAGRGRHNLDRMMEFFAFLSEEEMRNDPDGEFYWPVVATGMVRATYASDGNADVYIETGIWDEQIESTRELIATAAI